MKKKGEYEVINNQEDEDGYNEYPDVVHFSESAKGKQDINSNKSTAKTEPGPAELPMIFPGTKRRISQFIIFPSAKLVVR